MSKISTDASSSDESNQITFRDILPHEKVVEALEAVSIFNPTPVQQKSIPIALDGKDLVAQAQTGSGKTLAFSIPLVAKLISSDYPKDKTAALVITPTRELADQVLSVVQSLESSFEPVLAIGGVDINKQIKKLSSDCRIVVGTPGRILDLMRQKELSLKNCEYFVLDEADEMLSMGFLEDIRDILKKLPKERQGLFLSATITPRVDMLANSFLSSPEKIEIELDNDLIPDVDHSYYEVGNDLMAKPNALCDLIETLQPESAIIFCNTKSDTELVEALLRRKGFDARRLNSDLNQSQRNRVMKKIRAKELRFLIATDIAARGIDIEEIQLVVNYAIHEQSETYVHRTGRTGRAGKQGSAVSLVGPRDFGAFHYLTKVLDVEFTKKELPDDQAVANARLEHIDTILQERDTATGKRYELLAKNLVEQSSPEQLSSRLASLIQTVIETRNSKEVKSLEDELVTDTDTSPKQKRDRKRNKSDDDSELKAKSDRKPKGDSPRAKRGPEKRVYLGLGKEDGLTIDKFQKLAQSEASLKKEDIRNLTLRNHYGFVDLFDAQASSLIEALDQSDFNGKKFTIEVATTLTSNKKPSGRGRNNGNRSRDSDRRKGRRSSSRSRRS
jgi:ATP-dependent RNA helicase DeaD